MLTLLIHIEGQDPTRVTLEGAVLTVGRDADNSVQIDHPSVSGRHCAFLHQPDGRIWVRDMDSTNGTYVDGEAVTAAPVDPSRTITLGEVQITLEIEETAGAPPGGITQPALVPDREREPASAGGFWGALPNAFGYPLRGDAWLVMVIVVALENANLFLPGPLKALAFVPAIFLGLYVFQIIREIIESTITGGDVFPAAPNFVLDMTELRELFSIYFVVASVCFGPVMFLSWLTQSPGWVYTIAVGFGCFYFPMALLAIVVSGRLGAVSPTVVGPSIFRTGLAYLAPVLLLVGIALAGFLAGRLAQPLTENRGLSIAISVISSAVGLYLLLVWARVLGVFYRYHRERLAWDGVGPDATPEADEDHGLGFRRAERPWG